MTRPFAEKVQQLWGTVLNIVGIDREPREVADLQVSNKAVRSLSYLVAQDGKDGRLVLCDTSGHLIGRIVDLNGRCLIMDDYGAATVAVSQGNTIADVGGAEDAMPGHSALSVRNYALVKLAEVLEDVWDPLLHSIRTTEA